jgi:hypothetical protein
MLEILIHIIIWRKLAQQAKDEELGAIFQANERSIGDKAISVTIPAGSRTGDPGLSF